MKLRYYTYLYLAIIGIGSTLLLILSCLMFHPVYLGNRILGGSASLQMLSPSVRGLLFFLIGETLFIFCGARLFCKLTVNRIQELNWYLKMTISGKEIELKGDDRQDELTELHRSLAELYQRTKANQRELEKNYRQLAEMNQKLESNYIQSYNLQLIQEEISRELDIDQLLKKTADIIAGLFGSKHCSIYMVDEENETLIAKAYSGYMGKEAPQKVIAFNSNNIVARSWREKALLTEKDTKPEELAELHKRNTNSILTVPLIGRQGKIGVMVLEHGLAEGINADSVKFIRVVAQELSLSVENAYLYDKMRRMAIRDALTGAYNRLYLMTYMAEVLAKIPEAVSVLIFDLDHFKQINDKYGHLTGDAVLKTIVALVQKMITSGILARYGGEEFVIVLPDTGQDEAFQFANSIKQLVGHHRFITPEGEPISVTISIGLATYPLVSDDYEGLLQHADAALYEAKNLGRNRVCVAASNK